MKTISFVVFFGLLGLVVGYFVFAKIGNGYIDVTTLISGPRGLLGGVASRLMGFAKIRQNILIAGGVGALLGLVVSLAGQRPGR